MDIYTSDQEQSVRVEQVLFLTSIKLKIMAGAPACIKPSVQIRGRQHTIFPHAIPKWLHNRACFTTVFDESAPPSLDLRIKIASSYDPWQERDSYTRKAVARGQQLHEQYRIQRLARVRSTHWCISRSVASYYRTSWSKFGRGRRNSRLQESFDRQAMGCAVK